MTPCTRDDPSQRHPWLEPGADSRYNSAAERDAAQRGREATLAADRTSNAAALGRALGVLLRVSSMCMAPSSM